MTVQRQTRAQLLVELGAVQKHHKDEVAQMHSALREQRSELAAMAAANKETSAQFDDLKERLANSETECTRMRGYIARVQEDDVVREELVATGDPGGEQRLVPKRQHATFPPRSAYSDLSPQAGGTIYHHRNDRPPPRHWVTYGGS
jgi:seryl-tRNA synthetase